MKRTGKSRIRRWTTDRLIRHALTHGTDHRAWKAIACLQDRGSAATLSRIARLARSANVRRRILGMDIAAQLRCGRPRDLGGPSTPYAVEATQAVLVEALRDPDPGVLSAAIAGLGHRPAPDALPVLLTHAAHPQPGVRYALAHALGSYADRDATLALVRLAADADDDVRDWATFSLGTLSDADDDAIRSVLWSNAHDPNRDVRGEAVVGLARRSDPRVVELLKARLADDDCRVYELEAAEEMPRAELLDTLRSVRAEAEQRPDLDPYWYRHLLDAIDACELVADATA
jgi:hypothetical protein